MHPQELVNRHGDRALQNQYEPFQIDEKVVPNDDFLSVDFFTFYNTQSNSLKSPQHQDRNLVTNKNLNLFFVMNQNDFHASHLRLFSQFCWNNCPRTHL